MPEVKQETAIAGHRVAPISPVWLIWLPVLVAGLLLFVAALLLKIVPDASAEHLFRDPVMFLENDGGIKRPLRGFFSQLGAVIWFSGGVVSLFAAAMTWRIRPASRRYPLLLLALGAGMLLLGADDLFLLHETVYNVAFIPGELFATGLYATGALLFVRIFYPEVRRRYTSLFLTTMLFLALSVVVDEASAWVGELLTPSVRIFMEDGFKFLGITTAWTYCIAMSWQGVMHAVSTRQD